MRVPKQRTGYAARAGDSVGDFYALAALSTEGPLNHYEMTVRGVPAHVTQGDKVATRDPFSISASAGPVHVLLRKNGAKISGKATVSGKLPRPAYVVLAPKERAASLYYKGAVAAHDGSFSLQGVAPGAYDLFAFDQQEHYDGEVTLTKYAAAGTAVTLTAGEERSIDLNVIKVETDK